MRDGHSRKTVTRSGYRSMYSLCTLVFNFLLLCVSLVGQYWWAIASQHDKKAARNVEDCCGMECAPLMYLVPDDNRKGWCLRGDYARVIVESIIEHKNVDTRICKDTGGRKHKKRPQRPQDMNAMISSCSPTSADPRIKKKRGCYTVFQSDVILFSILHITHFHHCYDFHLNTLMPTEDQYILHRPLAAGSGANCSRSTY